MRRTEQAQGLRLMKFEEVYARTTARLLIQAEAAEVLGVSERTFRRWRDRYEVEGVEGLYDRAVAGGDPVLRRIEVAPKDLLFAHPLVGEEAIGRLRAGPVLAGQWDALSEPGINTLDQSTKAAVQAAVAKRAARKLLVKPPFLHDPHLFTPNSVPEKESRAHPSTQVMAATGENTIKMWVIESYAGRLPSNGVSRISRLLFLCLKLANNIFF